MYISDNGSLYSNGDANKKTTFITSEFSNYIPILELIEINHRKELTFANGINKNEEVVTYHKGLSGRNFTPDVIKRGNIDVTANDLFMGPMTIFLNFTNLCLTVVSGKEFRKTFVPIYNDKLQEFQGKVIIINLHTLNNPKNIQDMTGISNYLDSLYEKYKHRSSPNFEEMKEVIKFANEKWSETKIYNASIISNSLKVATMIELTDSNILTALDQTVYLPDQDYSISTNNILEAQEHPTSSNPSLNNQNVNKEIRKNSFTCYIVDNNDSISDRYINIAGTVKKISKFKDHNLVDGLHIITVDAEGKQQSEVVSDLNQLDNNRYVYKSLEEANAGADIRIQYKDNIELAKVELEVNKLEKSNEGVEIKALYDLILKQNEINKQEYNTALEQIKSELKLKEEQFKSKQERESIKDKRSYDTFKYDMERRSHTTKTDYEETKYQRDSFVEGLKTAGAIAGVLATGYVIYKKMNS